jgi:molybdenum cofactor biosynthesis enzyme MoaA
MKDILQRMTDQYFSPLGDKILVDAPPMPKNMMVELSNACNHACVFCANPYATRKIGRINSDLLFRIMSEARQGGVEEIGFYTTGEPFVHKDLTKFTRQAHELGYSYIYISTNGAMATPNRAKAVIDAGMDSIKFSINAGSRETYKKVHGKDEFDLVLANLQFISKYRQTLDRPLRLFVTFIVTKLTAHEVRSFRERVSQFVDDVFFHECTTQSGQMADAPDLLRNAELKRDDLSPICSMPFNRLHVTCEGYLTLCCTDYQNYLAVADLNAMSLTDAWISEDFRSARRRHLENDLAGTLCGNCWLGRRDSIQALVPALSAPLEYPKFYQEVVDQVRDRITDEPSKK